MTKASSSGSDLFVVRKSRLSRRLGRRRAEPRESSAAEWSETERQARTALFRETITEGVFDTLLQPIIDLKSGRAVGAEALARFRQTPLRPPNLWFAEAAELGLGVELEIAVMLRALEHLRRLPSGLYLSVNASVETIMSEQFQGAMADVPAERVVLELTEHTRVGNYERLDATLQHLRTRGVRLAVDDAGAGYASFRHVLNLRPDVIKLDIGLTRGIDHDPTRQALGKALLTFGLDAIKASIVAEGVETKGELDTLRIMGCPFGQGFYLGRPGRLRVSDSSTRASTVLWVPEAATAPTPSSNDDEGAASPGSSSASTTVAQVIEVEAPRRGDDKRETQADESRSERRAWRDSAEFLALAAEIQELQRNEALVG